MPSNKEIVKFCCDGSVLSQCKSIVRNKNKKWIFFWSAVFIVTLAGGLWYGLTAIQDYLSWPSHLRYYMADIQDLPFPAVTVCNLNPMDKNRDDYAKNIQELMILYRYYASQLRNNTPTPPKKDPMNPRFKRAPGSTLSTFNSNSDKCVPKTTTATFTTTQEPTTSTIVTTTQEPTTVLTSTPAVTTTATLTTEATTPLSITTTVSTAKSGPILSTFNSNSDKCVPTTTTAAVTTTQEPTTSTIFTTTQETIASTSLPADASTSISQPATTDAFESTKITQPKTSDHSVTSSLTSSQTTGAAGSTTRKTQSTTTTDTSDVSTTSKLAQSSTSDSSATTSASQSPFTDSSETTKQTESPTSDASAMTMQTRLPTTDVSKQTTTVPQTPTTEAETTIIITKSSTVEKSGFETTTLIQLPTTDDLKQTTKLSETSTTDKSDVETTTPLSKSFTTDESQSTTNLDHSPSDSSIKTTVKLTQPPITDTSYSKTLKILTTKPTTSPNEKTESPITDTAKSTKATSATPTATAGSTFTKTTPTTLSTSTVEKVLSSSTHSAKSTASTSTSETIPSETTLIHPSSSAESSTTEQYTTALPSEVPSSTTIFESLTSPPTTIHSSSTIKLISSTIANQMQTQKYATIPSTKMTTESLLKTTSSSTNSFENIFTTNQITTSVTLTSEIQPTTVHSSIASTTSNDENKNDATTVEQNTQASAMSATTANQMQTQQSTTIPSTIDSGDGITTTSLTGHTTTVSHSSLTEKTEPLFETSATGSSITPTSTKAKHVSTGSTSSAAVSTNENPNENTGSSLPTSSTSLLQPSDDETVSISSSKLPTTLTDATRSTTLNSELISSTPSSIKSTTPEPIVFEIYTQKEINELEAKYKISSSATSRIALESKIQDRLVGMMRTNQNGGYGIKDIIIQCTFDKDECDMDNDFVQMYDPWFGNCYTFNYDGRYGIAGVGTNYGLKMQVFSNISEYMETSSRSGFKIVLHRQDFAPFPSFEGLYVKTGKRSSINVKYSRSEHLPAPYGICQPDDNTTAFIYEGLYTEEGCLRSCYQHKIIENCSCADPRFPKPKGSNVSWCDGTNLKNFLCYANYLETYGEFHKVSNCYCPAGCTAHSFNYNIATAKWPLKVEPFVTPLCNEYWPKTNIKCYDAYEKNAAMIGISHFNLLYRRNIQEADYWWWDVFEMFMGNLGLFTGITCLAVPEFLEFLIYLILRPKWISEKEESDDETDDNEMKEMSRKKDNKIYDSNMIEENSVDIPLPFIGHTSAIGLDSSMESEDANRNSATKTSLDILNELESAEPNQPKSSSGFQVLQGSSLVDNGLEKYLNSLLFKPQICPFNWRKYHPELPMETGYNSPYSNNPYLPVLPLYFYPCQSGSSNDTPPIKFDEKK